MNTLKKLENLLINKPASSTNDYFRHLVEALCLRGNLDMAALYELSYEDFKLAMEIMHDWRLHQYTKTKERLRELVLLPHEEPEESAEPETD